MRIEELVALSVKHNAGDLHLCSGHSPFWRRNGRLEKIPSQPAIAGSALEALAARLA